MENISINKRQNAIIKSTLNLEEYVIKYLTPSKSKDLKSLIIQFKNAVKNKTEV